MMIFGMILVLLQVVVLLGVLHGADAKEHSAPTDEEADALAQLPADMEKWTRHDVATWLLHYAGIDRDYVKVLHDASKLKGTFWLYLALFHMLKFCLCCITSSAILT